MLSEIHVPEALLNQKSGQQMLGSVLEDTPGGSPTPRDRELPTWELPKCQKSTDLELNFNSRSRLESADSGTMEDAQMGPGASHHTGATFTG